MLVSERVNIHTKSAFFLGKKKKIPSKLLPSQTPSKLATDLDVKRSQSTASLPWGLVARRNYHFCSGNFTQGKWVTHKNISSTSSQNGICKRNGEVKYTKLQRFVLQNFSSATIELGRQISGSQIGSRCIGNSIVPHGSCDHQAWKKAFKSTKKSSFFSRIGSSLPQVGLENQTT